MILSALLTSVGINLGLCFLFFTLYSILRKQPGNADVYAPRLVAEGKLEPRNNFNLERLLPSTSWVNRSWYPSEEELLARAGLDGVVFMRVIIFSLKVFAFAGVVGLCALLPINYTGSQIVIDFSDFSDFTNQSLESFSISNVNDGLKWLWFHFGAIYVFTAFVCYLLYLSEADKVNRRLAHLKSTQKTSQRFGRVGFLGLFRPKVGLVEYYEKKLEDLEDNARTQQSLLSGKEVPAAFVSFKSRLGTAVALHVQQGENPTEWLTERAPEPEDVYWPFFSASFISRWIGNVMVVFACVILTILFFIPVIIVQSLTHLEQLETWFPFLKGVLNITFISQVITGYLPSLILKMFLYLVPPVMIMLSSIQGYVAHSQIEKSACNKMLWFTIWNIFFANSLSGSVLYRVNIFLEPKEIPNILAVAVPGQATFFITYVVTSGWTSTASELLRLMPLVSNFMGRIFLTKAEEKFEVPSLPYSSEIPSILLFGLLGITYFFLSPLILPFLLVYYCLAYIIYRHQLLNVYSPKFETGGTFWPIVHNSMVFSLILMHMIAVGIFGLKKLPLASSLTIPLPIITLLFNNLCRKRFLPVFKGYPAECMIKKDRSNESMSDFYERLATAYQDPALKPIHFSGRTDGHNAPLLASET